MNVRARTLSELLRASGVEALGPVGPDARIGGVSLDSRRIAAGDAFFAIRGFSRDGEEFAPQAARGGAAAIFAASERPAWVAGDLAWVRVEDTRRAAGLVSRELFDRPDEALALVGITGTNGKTTVAYMVESIARAAGRRVGRLGTTGHSFAGVEQPSDRTTPEAPDFYRLLARMREETVEIVVMEVSSHALALSRVEGARFTVAAFLNLGRDHLDFHGDESTYFEAKASLIENLDPDRTAVLPADLEHGRELRGRTRARVLSFGRGAEADVRLRDERFGIDGSSAVLETPKGTLPVRSFLLGRVNMDNVAAAAACALALELPAESVPAGILTLQRVPGRMEKVECGQSFTVVVDFAHTEQALRGLLTGLREVAAGRLHVVFGCGGNRDRGKRFDMGRAAAQLADRIYLTSDNPRDEDPRTILDAIAEGVDSVAGARERCAMIEDRAEAIRSALKQARDRDVVVLAGKGHENTQTIGAEQRPFDDRFVAIGVLESLGYHGGGVGRA